MECVITIIVCYFILNRKKILFDDRFAITITKSATLISTIVFSIHFSVILSAQLSIIFLLNIVIGIIIGALFGSLVKYHSFLIGIYHGIIGSSMGVMIGEVLKNPEICSIPIASKQEVLMNIYQLCGFTTLLLTLVLSLVIYSMRV